MCVILSWIWCQKQFYIKLTLCTRCVVIRFGTQIHHESHVGATRGGERTFILSLVWDPLYRLVLTVFRFWLDLWKSVCLSFDLSRCIWVLKCIGVHIVLDLDSEHVS